MIRMHHVIIVAFFALYGNKATAQPFSNAEDESFGCIQGQLTTDPESGEIILDSTKHVVCTNGETKCYLQQFLMKHDYWSALSKMGGCFNEDYEEFFDPGAEELERFSSKGVKILDYSFETCDESSDCLQYSPKESQAVINCNTGLTVSEVATGRVEFDHHYSEQCKFHSSCEIVTVFQYIKASKTSKKYEYSGCGDPYNTRYENLNVLPFVPPSPSELDRHTYCTDIGCVEHFFGLCLCPRDWDLSPYVVMYGVKKDMCDTDNCN